MSTWPPSAGRTPISLCQMSGGINGVSSTTVVPFWLQIDLRLYDNEDNSDPLLHFVSISPGLMLLGLETEGSWAMR